MMGQTHAANKHREKQEVMRARAANDSMSHHERSENQSAKEFNDSGDERLCEGRSVLRQPMCTREFGGIAEVFLLDMALRSHLHGQGHFFFLFR